MKKSVLIGIIIIIIFLAILITYSLSIKKENPLCKVRQDPNDKCDGIYLGAEYFEERQKCETVSWGCRDPPFKNLEECQKICE